jgi:hypothetical protein
LSVEDIARADEQGFTILRPVKKLMAGWTRFAPSTAKQSVENTMICTERKEKRTAGSKDFAGFVSD